MKNKSLYSLSVIFAGLFFQALPTGVHAAPLVSIGDHADVFFNGSSSLRWASNIFRDEDDEMDDLMWTLSPGFEINLGRGISNADLSIITRYDIVRYEDREQLDTELFSIKAVASYRSSRLDLSGSVSFDENKTSSGNINVPNDLVESDTYGANLNGEYRLSPKFSFGTGVSYQQRKYQNFTNRFADSDTITLPFDVFYELTPKVDLSVGYSYSRTDVDATLFNPDGDYTRETHFYNVGARGNLLPKLTGFFKVGYRAQENDLENSDESGMLGLDANLTWSATPKLTVSFGSSIDFGVGGEGQSTKNYPLNLSANYSINSYFSASANLDYTLRDYTDGDREDNQYTAGLRLFYTPNEHWRFSTGYIYNENVSDEPELSYVNHSIELTATLRY